MEAILKKSAYRWVLPLDPKFFFLVFPGDLAMQTGLSMTLYILLIVPHVAI